MAMPGQNKEKPESAHDKFAREHPFAPTSWGPPDVNPADAAIARMQRNARLTAELQAQLAQPIGEAGLAGRVRRLEELLTGVIDSLNGATIEAICNEDTTITVTLTLPDLPGA